MRLHPPSASGLTGIRLGQGWFFSFLIIAFLSVPYASELRAQVLEYTTEVEIYPGKLITTNQYVIEISKRENDWLSDVAIPYQEDEDIELLEAVILDGKGNPVRSLSRKEVTTRHDVSSGSFFEDNRVYEFKLRWHQYPYQIRYSYRHTQDKYIYACRWSPELYVGLTTAKAALTVTAPKELRVHIHQRPGTASPPQPEVLKNRHVYRWTFSDIPAIRRELNGPPMRDQRTLITVAPDQFLYGIPGRLDSWESYGRWVYQLNDNLSELPLDEQQKVRAMTRDARDQTDLMRRLYHYVQDNTRYINVAMDVGGLKSYSATYVSTKKYGDCKALTVFMQSLLSSVGIPSYYAHVYGNSAPARIDADVPGPQFNHMILSIPREKDTLWLENTANYLPFNYLGTFTQNRTVLLIKKDGSTLVRTPALSTGQVTNARTFTYEIKPEGVTPTTARWRLRGELFEDFKSRQLNGKETDIQEMLEDALPRKDYRLAGWTLEKQDRDSAFVDVGLALEATSVVRVLGADWIIKPLAVALPNFETPQARTLPVQLSYPVAEDLTLIYKVPDFGSFQVELPGPVELSSPFGKFTIRYTRSDQAIVIRKELLLASGHYPIERYPEFYGFLVAIRESDRASSIALAKKH